MVEIAVMGAVEAGVTVEVVIEVSTEVLLLQKPVEVGKEYEVDITEISRQGDGIAMQYCKGL
jgi:hypothetical protein